VTPEGRGWTALNGPWTIRRRGYRAGSEAANAFYHGHDAGVSSGDLGVLRDICNRRRMREQGFTVARARELARADVLANRAAIKRVRDQLDERGRREDTHVYLSTACLHSYHAYCAAMTGQQGAKRPARCKSAMPGACAAVTTSGPEQPQPHRDVKLLRRTLPTEGDA